MHWKYAKKIDPKNNFGFIYTITHKKTKKAYIGCKQYLVTKNKRKLNQTGGSILDLIKPLMKISKIWERTNSNSILLENIKTKEA